MEQRKRFSKSVAMALALIMLLPVIAVVAAACGAKTVYHKVTFYAEDKQQVLQYVRVKDGKEAVYSGITPTKEGNETYEYTFFGWVDENGSLADLTTVEADMSVYASFVQSKVKYNLIKPANVTVRRNGSALQSGNVLHYGDELIVSYTESLDHYMVDFKINGTRVSNNCMITVRGNVEIIYQEEVIPDVQVSVTFYSEDGQEELSTVVVKYGQQAVYDGVRPTKDADGTYMYEFDGWANSQGNLVSLASVKSDMSVYAHFKKKATVYRTLSFIGPEGEVVSTQNVVDGTKLTTAPTEIGIGYKLLRWDYDFDSVVTQNEDVKGFFVKDSEKIDGAQFTITGEMASTVLHISITEGSDIYTILQNEIGDGGVSIPTSFDMAFDDIYHDISNEDRTEYGEVTSCILFRNEEMNFSFWAGYFEDANVLSLNVEGLGTDYDNLFLTQDCNGVCGVYKNVYGISGRRKIEGLEQDKIEGASLTVAPSDTGDWDEIGGMWTLDLVKDSVMYNIAAKEFGVSELPTSLELTVSNSRSGPNILDWERRNYGNVERMITLTNAELNISFELGLYMLPADNYIVSIDSSSFGVGVSNIFILVKRGQTNHYFYTTLQNFELIDEMATINYIDLNGNVLATKTSRVGAYVPSFGLKSNISGYKIVGWTNENPINNGDQYIVAGENNFYALYVKEDEADGTTLTIHAQRRYGVNVDDTIDCTMATESTIYQYLSKCYDSNIPTILTWVVSNGYWDETNKCERFEFSVQGMSGPTENVRYYGPENIIATTVYDVSGEESVFMGNCYFVTDEHRLGDGVVFTCYKNIYSYHNIFKG